LKSPENRSVTDYLGIYARGLTMGMADLVPGVSGGTIAFVAGIYDELLGTIAGLRWSLVQDLFRDGLVATWRKANLTFLVALGSGMLTSIFALANLLQHLLADYPVQVWSFFFGLVAASVVLVARFIPRWNANLLIAGAIGIAAAGWITSLPPLMQSDSLFFLALCGSIAIIAMILPGISGSFILLILGAYAPVIQSITEFNVLRLSVFAVGVAVGLLGFSRLLHRLLERKRDPTLAVLTGFLLGSLNAVWPWKKNAEILYTHSDGRPEWFRVNDIPPGFEGAEGIGMSLALALAGAVTIAAIEWAGTWAERRRAAQAK
jgi:putative membrane protein